MQSLTPYFVAIGINECFYWLVFFINKKNIAGIKYVDKYCYSINYLYQPYNNGYELRSLGKYGCFYIRSTPKFPGVADHGYSGGSFI